MSEQPAGTLDNDQPRFKHYSRPVQYSQRPRPQLFSDVTDQFAPVHQASIDQTIPQAAPKPVAQPQASVSPAFKQPIHQPTQQAPIRPQPVVNPIATAAPRPQVDALSQPMPVQQPIVQPQPIQQATAQPQPLANPVVSATPSPQIEQFSQPMPVQQATIQLQPPQPIQQPAPIQPQVVQAPTYTNNYNGEYEDVKKKRFNFSLRNRFSKKAVVYSSSVAVTVLLAGAFAGYMNWNNTKNIAHAQASSNAPTSNDQPSIQTPEPYASTTAPTISEVANFSVPPNDPKYLIIPKLNIHSIIKPLSLDTANQLVAPDNIYDAGWWSTSSEPGQSGVTVIDGFTTNGTKSGLFSSLDSLAPGDTFQVENGSGTMFNYKVVKSEAFGANSLTMDQAISPATSSAGSSLNIITCSGKNFYCPSSTGADFVLFATEVN